MEPEEEGTPSERFERSPIGQILISALIIVLIAVEIGTNLPDSAVADRKSVV